MNRRDIGMGLLVAIIWGFNFVVADEAVKDVPPLLLVALRYAVVAVAFLWVTRRGGIRWRFLIAVGLLYGVVQFSGLFLGLHLGVGAGVAATLIQSQALFTVLLAGALLGERFGVRSWVGLAVGALGLGLIAASGGEQAPILGVLCVLGGAAGWAASNIVLKRAGAISAWSMTVWQSVVVVPVMLVLSAVFEHGQLDTLRHMSLKTAGAIGYIALLATGVGNYAWYRLIQRVGPSRTAPFSLLVPVVGLLSGWLVLGEGLSGLQLAGVLLVLAGLVCIVLKLPSIRRRPPAGASLPEDAPAPAQQPVQAE